MGLLSGKNTIVTGGSRGIGKAICEAFAAQGANVAFTYMSSEESAKKIEADLSAKGVKAMAVKSDAANYQQAEDLINKVLEAWGSIDVIVNNAGITRDGLLMRMTEEQFDEVVATNLKSVFNTTKAAQRTLLKQRSGSIINLSSVVGVYGNAGQANYAASKAGIIGFTKSIAQELGSRNIRCNAIAPGFIETEMTAKLDEKVVKEWAEAIPMKRGGKPEEVADLCVFLGSDMSSYISGQTINICGAMRT
ncbi:MAG: 3-oxoacyl-[acyl-carrier-protein] reductase [Luteibaculum sp.]